MNRACYEAGVCSRLGQSEKIPFRRVTIGEWSPNVSDCHENVDAWVKAHPDCTAVRGWVTYAHFSNNTDGLTAHSVVRGADDVLFDITPLKREEDRKAMRFVPHLGSEEEFAAERQRNIFIECPSAGDFCP